MGNLVEYKYKLWCDKVTDENVLAQLSAMKVNAQVKIDCFYKDLSFGTGGLRGIIGAGTNCLNIYTVSKITYGLVKYLQEVNGKSVAVSFDSRKCSDLFAKTVARVFATNGIKVYLSSSLMPAPFLSFVTRYYGCDCGVMITASHNPSQYNGYKVYGNDGCQLTDVLSLKVAKLIETVDEFGLNILDFDVLINNKKIVYIDQKAVNEYLKNVSSRSLTKIKDNLKIVYSPLNGAGYKLVPEILSKQGHTNVVLVSEQSYPDGNFPTCPYPNPEKKEALELGVKLANQLNADLLLATDPDCDRVGIAVRNNGNYSLLTGNEVGVLLTDYILQQLGKAKKLNSNSIVVKTIVTSQLVQRICDSYNVKLVNVLTGFKYIGEIIGELEKQGNVDDFVFGFEESYGYLSGSYVRDKDAVVACMLIAEMASYYKDSGLTLSDRLTQLYKQYGFYTHKLLSYKFEGATGFVKMQQLLSEIRAKSLGSIAGIPCKQFIDYLYQTELNLPPADVLQYDLDGNNQVIIRPSGTEPLIKVYITVSQDVKTNEILINNITAFIDNLMAYDNKN